MPVYEKWVLLKPSIVLQWNPNFPSLPVKPTPSGSGLPHPVWFSLIHLFYIVELNIQGRNLLLKEVWKSEMQIFSKVYAISRIRISEFWVRGGLTKVKGSPIAGHWLCWQRAVDTEDGDGVGVGWEDKQFPSAAYLVTRLHRQTQRHSLVGRQYWNESGPWQTKFLKPSPLSYLLNTSSFSSWELRCCCNCSELINRRLHS